MREIFVKGWVDVLGVDEDLKGCDEWEGEIADWCRVAVGKFMRKSGMGQD